MKTRLLPVAPVPRRSRVGRRVLLFAAALLLAGFAHAQQAGGLRLKTQAVNVAPNVLLDPAAAAWKSAPASVIALNRTPQNYSTELPADLEIATAEVRLLRAGNALLVRLAWKDATRDTAEIGKALPKPSDGPQIYKAPSEPDRFFDACAVMLPDRPGLETVPALQMGSPESPVTIYFLDTVRGPAVMQAQGRGTTRRTGTAFAGRAVYDRGGWSAVLQLAATAGTPLAFAVWNGSQQDRDGRKYFSVWHYLEN